MNESTGLPAPTLPPPGTAPAAAVPDAPVGLPAPAASQPLSAPTLPDHAMPSLPAVANAPTPPSSADAPATTTPIKTSKTTGKSNKAFGRLLVGAVVLGIGAAGYLGLSSLSGGSDDGGVAPPRTIAPDATSPLLVPINDAKEVVDRINDNEVEAELLEEMGLDGDGSARDPDVSLPSADPPSSDDVLPTFAPDALLASTTEPDGSGTYVYDDGLLAEASVVDRATWLRRWNLDADAPPAGTVTVEIVMFAGQVQRVDVDAPASAGGFSASFDVVEPTAAAD